MIALTQETIDVGKCLAGLKKEGAGSVVMHLGVVKPDPEGRRSSGITFEALDGLAEELAAIEDHVRQKLRVIDVALVRRVGHLAVGDVIFFGAVSASDRVNAFAACRELVERVKKLKCLNKREHYVD